MTNRKRAIAPVESAALHTIPRWERQRPHRQLLDRRVRSVRRTMLAGGVIGTVAFSALAGYETKIANGTSAGASAALKAPESQLDGANFFIGQASATLAPASPTVIPVPTETATPTTTATETATATPDANATTSA